jgi:hypothetical protein
MSKENMEWDELKDMEGRPDIGCFIVIVGTILFWTGVYKLVSFLI